MTGAPGLEFQAQRNKIKTGRNKIKIRRKDFKIQRNKSQISFFLR
jgi:hypothetical protein